MNAQLHVLNVTTTMMNVQMRMIDQPLLQIPSTLDLNTIWNAILQMIHATEQSAHGPHVLVLSYTQALQA